MSDEAASFSSQATEFGEYELIEQIGRGGMGVVYKARQVSRNRFVALKMLGPHASAFPGIAQRLRAEAEVAGGLHHPQIVSIYDVGEHEGHPFFTMELIDGSGLDQFIGPDGFRPRTEPPPADRRVGPDAAAARLMVQIGRAVNHAHSYGVLHRDLKPANILIDARGEPHLTDFGLAKVLGRAASTGTASGSVLGTPAYMAPEQASGGAKHASTAADVYSLGTILYEMLTGRPPFRAETPLETLRRVVEDPPKPPSSFNRNLDGDLAIICLKCLEKDPADRYPSALALAEDLGRWLQEQPIAARTARPVERLWRWCRREPALSSLLGGVLLLLTTVAVLGLTLAQKQNLQLEHAEKEMMKERKVLLDRIDEEWAVKEPVRISAKELAQIAGLPLVEEGGELRVTLGFTSRLRKPDEAIQSIVPLVIHLQTNLATASQPRLWFELQIFRNHTNAIQALRQGQLEVLRVDPADYVLLRQEITNVQLVARQVYSGQASLEGAIFVRVDSGLTNLSRLRGTSFLLGEQGTALGDYLPKAALVAAGLGRTDFRQIGHARSVAAIAGVRTNAFDVGVAERDDLDNAARLNARYQETHGQLATHLRTVHPLACPNDPWLASSRLPREVTTRIREALLSLRDYGAPLPFNPKLMRFEAAHPSDYDALARQIDQAKRFDSSSASRK